MTNETKNAVGVFGAKSAMLSPEALTTAMAASTSHGTQRPDGDFINFSGKRGVYEIGQEKRGADKDEPWLVNVSSFEDGYICWKGGAPVATRLYPMGTPLPALDRSEHGPFLKDGDGWYDAKSMVIRSLETGDQGYFKINSVSGVSAFSDLQRSITARLRSGESYWPVIQLHSGSFTSKGFKNGKPVLNIIGWLDNENVGKLAEAFETDAEIDLDELFAASNGVAEVPSTGEKANRRVAKAEPVQEAAPATRTRRRL